MATIDVTTLGVLTQADVAGTLISGGPLINWGRSPGETLSTRQRFQHASGYPLPNPQAVVAALPAGTVATLIARNASGGVIDTWEFTVLGSRVLDGGAAFPGASRYRVEIDMDLDIGTSGSWANPPGAAVNNYVIRGATTTSGDVSSHRNFNFNNTVTLDLIRGANQLGTDANGRIIPTADRDVQITTGAAFPTTPERGDFHFLTSTISGTGSADPGIDPVVNSSGATLTYENYVAGAVGIDVPSINIVNIQISDQRNTVTPRLGVAGQTVELFYRSSESDPWEFFGNTTDSAVNGNQFRVRLARMPLAAVNLPNVSVGDQIGYQARPARTVVMDFDPGTYIYDGSAWQQLNANTAPTSTSSGIIIQENGTTEATAVETLNFAGGLSIDTSTSVPTVDSLRTNVIDSTGGSLVINALNVISEPLTLGFNIDFGVISDYTDGDFLTIRNNSGTTINLFEAVGHSVFIDGDRVGAFPGYLLLPGVTLELVYSVATTPNGFLNASGSSLTVQEEGDTPIERVDNIVFDNRHFSVLDRSNGDVEIFATAALTGGIGVDNEDEDGMIADVANAPSNLITGRTLVSTIGAGDTAAAANNVTLNVDAEQIPYYQVHNFSMGDHDVTANPTGFFDVGGGVYEIRIGRVTNEVHSGSWTTSPPIVQVYELEDVGMGRTRPVMVIPMDVRITASNQITISFTQNDFNGRVTIIGI